MAKQKPRTLSGFMELLPQRQVQFDRMVELLRRSYSLYGFTPLDTPVIEASEVLLARPGLPLPPLPDRQGVPGRARPAGPLP